MNLKSKSALAVLTLIAAVTGMTQAQAAEPAYTLDFNVGVVSDYRVRGIAQTSEKPAVQGGVDLGLSSGLYLGLWGSNINWIKDYAGATQGDYEIDVYAGYKGALGESGLSYDLGVISFQYPGNTVADLGPGFVNASTTEAYVALSYGVATLKLNHSVSDFLGVENSKGSQYIDLSASFDLGSGYSLTPHVGHQSVANVAGGVSDYTDYALTLAKDMGNGLSLTAAAMGTDAKEAAYTDRNGKFLGKSVLVVGAKYSF
ncbi:MAG: TorF family putative porin [Hylemonella sp.]|nr:TorF family putative porin [Hylemonella sp.]